MEIISPFNGNTNMLPVEKTPFGRSGIGQIPFLTSFRKCMNLRAGMIRFFDVERPHYFATVAPVARLASCEGFEML
jgi:hypothetical protein